VTALNRMAFAVGFGIGRTIAFFLGLPGRVIAAITTLGPLLAAFFISTGEKAKNDFIAKFLALVDFVRSVPGRVVQALRELPGQIVKFATELGPKAIQLGKDIVSGIVKGIMSTIGDVGSALKGGFDSALAGLKKGLGIASPSKVYAQVGEDTIAGYVKGVQRSAEQAQAATLDALAPAATSARVAAPAAAPRQAVDVRTDDPFLSLVLDWLREQIRSQHGGSVDMALSTIS
jgi:hypothetical protein